MSEAIWHEKLNRLMAEMYIKAIEFGGQVSGEHGIGHAKITYLKESLGDTAIDLMKAIKFAFDPKNVLNPGKVC